MVETEIIGFRVSPAQRQAWALARTWVQAVVGLDGPVDEARLSAAARTVRERHEILRTRIASVPGRPGPVQVIDDDPAGLDATLELPAGADATDSERLAAAAAAETTRINVADGPATRLVLARLGEDRVALILTAHAAVADDWSLRMVARELDAAYAQRALPDVAVQYADFAAWHHDLLVDAARVPRRSYWDRHTDPRLPAALRDMLGGAPTAGEWNTRWCALGPTVTAGAAALAVSESAPEHAVLAAAWAILLWRLSGERDVTLTALVAGRAATELRLAIGPYARDVPLVCRFDAGASFADVVAQVHMALRQAEDYADDLDPARLSGDEPAPAFEWITDLGEAPPDRPDGQAQGQGQARLVQSGRRLAAPVALRVEAVAGDYRIGLGHDPRRLPDAAALALLERFRILIASLVADPGQAVEAAAISLPGEAAALLAVASGPPALKAAEVTLHAAFAGQAGRTPQAMAVDDGIHRLTYGELDQRATGLARNLARIGVGPGRRVVVWMPRGVEVVVAMLAVLKTGAAYVPVDVAQPLARLRFIVDDIGAQHVIVGPGSPAIADPAIATIPVELGAEQSRTGEGFAPHQGSGADLAYVIYTSGSTGQPNGVAITHHGLLNYLRWAADTYAMRDGGGAIVHTSIAFDLTVTGLLGPLVVGQRVRLVGESPGLSELVRVLRAESDVTLLKVTPSQLEALLDVVPAPELAARTRTIVLGGEQLRAEVLAGLRAQRPGQRIVNEYGPTECVVGSCAHEVGPGTPAAGPVPIGRPIADTRIYLLDAAGRLVPDGVPGEIVIGGAGVAPGYVGRPQLTAARFAPDPAAPRARAYRTGDRARRLPDGNLVYEGRLDDQLKVRGFRVEPGEVEATLVEHAGIARAAVVGWSPSGAASPPTQLVAYVVAAQGAPPPNPVELSAFCRHRLPDHLVPVTFHALPGLPSTPNGKLDRRALAEAAAGARDGVDAYAAPRAETEEILAGAIAAVLGRERVGIDDNYFTIGGDSIRSVMIASRAHARGVPITVADLHRLPTVRALADALIAGAAGEPEPVTAPFSLVSAEDRALMPPDVEDAFPLNLLQEGMIFHRAFAAKSAVYHAIASIRLRAPLDVGAMRTVIRQLVERHPMLRTSFDQTTFSRPLQLVHRAFPDPLSHADLRDLTPSEQQRHIDAWVDSEKQRGFELDDHPLIRFMAQSLDDETFQFTYGFHHEIVDGWSEALMVTQLFGHYFSLVFGEPFTPEPPRSSMRDAVALELQALQRPENFAFWTDYLRDVTLMRLPRLQSGPTADRGAREIVRIAVPVSAELSDKLKRLALTNSVPLKSVLLGAHMAVMNHYHGQCDTLTYTVTNGRPEQVDGSTAIGLFVNSLAVRVALTGGTWLDLIISTLDSERRSVPYRRLPMAELKRHQGNEPLAETLFFFTDYHVFRELDHWRAHGVDHVASELYGESTFPFCAIFRLNRDSGQLEVRIEYDSLQFAADQMDRVADDYRRVLDVIVDDPNAAYHTRSLLSDPHRRWLLDQLNDTGPAGGGGTGIDALVAEQARTTPDAIAVVSSAGAVTYAELDRAAQHIAKRLRARGAGADRVVGLLAERSIEAVVAVLAILKAGAAYLPLDPGHPDRRLGAVVAEADPVLVLADPAHLHRLPGVAVVALLPAPPFVDGDAELAGSGIAVPATNPDQLAYVISTSGSAGTPKSVGITHRGLVNSTLARTRYYQAPPERFLLLSSLAFDSSVAGLFWPLCAGGTLHLPTEGSQLEPAVLLRMLVEQGITHTLAVPSLLSALLEQAEPAQLTALRVMIVAGEASPKELLAAHRAAMPHCALVNEYGPTENAVWSTAWSGEPAPHQTQLPIGAPVAGIRAYVLNPHQQPVPVGVAAQLYLGGVNLARGYLGAPARTAASFVPDPYAGTPGARMYRTGDLVRRAADGDLEFLGRMDHQVKIRGFRVELGEIEGMLDAQPSVHRSVVVARDGASGNGASDNGLVAYVAPVPGGAPQPAALQQHLRELLPKYMVPATVVVLDALPTTPTGKVDRSALPPVERASGRRAEPAPPRTATEQVVAAIWQQALGLEDVGADDDFFDVGGESLRAMQVVNRTNKVFGLRLSVRALFDACTVAAFAEVVDRARVDDAAAVSAGVE